MIYYRRICWWRWRHTSNTADFETGANLGRQLSLRSAQYNIEELLLSRHRRDVLPGRLHLGRSGCFEVEIVLGIFLEE